MHVPKHTDGFTLIELMITVAIVAILAAIAYPSYRSSILRSNRTEAKSALLGTAQTLEKCFVASTPSTYAGCAVTFTTPNGYYTVTPTLNPATYTLSAVAAGSQAADVDCESFSVDEIGRQTATNSTSADTSTKCWK